jgi:16S rRNA (uracil1498-N3)-methyltransferase
MPSTAADRPAAPGPDARPPLFVAAAGELAGDVIVLSGAEGRHAATVRRLAPGERVEVTDGAGQLAECVVTQARPGTLRLAVQARHVQRPAAPALVVVQALAKGDRGQLAVELLTETGADVIVPWAAQRSVTRWQGERGERALARWRATAQEAAKQARRARFPVVTPLADGPGVARLVRSAALAVLLDPDAGTALAALTVPAQGEVVVIVGPEGGVSPAEAIALTAAGAVGAHLGPTVLRTSTAGVVAVSVLFSRSGRWP